MTNTCKGPVQRNTCSTFNPWCCSVHLIVLYVCPQVRPSDRRVDSSGPHEHQQGRGRCLSSRGPSIRCGRLWWTGVSQYCGSIRPSDKRVDAGTHTQGNWMRIRIIFYKYICMSALVCGQAAVKHALNHDLVNNKVVKQTHSLSLTFLQLLSKASWYVSIVM